MARPKFKATQALRERVRSFAAVGTKQEEIARVIGCSAKTLRLHFRNELLRGAIEANANVAGKLYQTAITGNVAAMIFWLRARAGWRDSTPRTPSPVDSYSPAQTPRNPHDNTVIILPYNKRFDLPKITERDDGRRRGRSPFGPDPRPSPLCLPEQGNVFVEEPDESQ